MHDAAVVLLVCARRVMLTFVRVTGMPMPQFMLQFGTFMFPFLIKQAGYEQVRAAVMAARGRCNADCWAWRLPHACFLQRSSCTVYLQRSWALHGEPGHQCIAFLANSGSAVLLKSGI